MIFRKPSTSHPQAILVCDKNLADEDGLWMAYEKNLADEDGFRIVDYVIWIPMLY